jgi:transaldolase
MSTPSSPETRTPRTPEPPPLKAPLRIMTQTTATRFFNDSCAADELHYAIERGATGATSNPVICLNVLRSERDRWIPRAREIVLANPRRSENGIAWQLYCEMAEAGAALMEPVFKAQGFGWGRLSVQTDPTLYRDADAMLQQSVQLSQLAPNAQVKMPATQAGISMVEEATFRGVNLNVTVSFSVPQVMAIAEAIERGLVRRDRAGLDNSLMAPVATMMIGRLDDWLKVIAKRQGIDLPDDVIDWAGIACAKRALALFEENRFRTKLLAAAYRHLGHWTELIGADMVLTMPYEWQVKANRSGISPEPRAHLPVDPVIVAQLHANFADFTRAYEPDGMTHVEFDTFGPTVRTLRSFIVAWHDFVGVVRDVMLPDPAL